MSKLSILPRDRFKPFVHNLKLFAPAVLFFIALFSFQVWSQYLAELPSLQASGMPISEEIEERFGVRFLGVHVLARNGLVDLRYRVIDAGKAKNFGHYAETSPLIIAEDSDKKIEVTIMGLHNHRVEAGRVYYILYRNTANALKPGDRVSIQLGDMLLKHVPVE